VQKGLEKRWIPKLNQEVTFLGFGALSIGRDWGYGSEQQRSRPSDEEAYKILNAVLDRGITLIDTASAYHRSEERIGQAISNRRNEYVLASKCGEHNEEPGTLYDFSYKAIKNSIDQSLRLLRTDVIDIMQIHFGPNPEKVIEDGETVAAMKDAQREGKIRFLGASIGGDLARKCIESGDFDVMQMEYNLLNQENHDNIQLAKERGIGVFIRGGLARGLLSPRVLSIMDTEFKYKAEVQRLLALANGNAELLSAAALQFLYREPGIHSVLIGTKNMDHFESNFALLERKLGGSGLDGAI
jgi:aryl-alcohol dehydrogenase-like predicted oxidoreductase